MSIAVHSDLFLIEITVLNTFFYIETRVAMGKFYSNVYSCSPKASGFAEEKKHQKFSFFHCGLCGIFVPGDFEITRSPTHFKKERTHFCLVGGFRQTKRGNTPAQSSGTLFGCRAELSWFTLNMMSPDIKNGSKVGNRLNCRRHANPFCLSSL